MRRRVSLIGRLVELRIFDRFWRRAMLFAPILVVLLALSFFPERYRAAVSLTPTDPETLGLSGTLGQLGAINSVFGKQADIEVALRIASSVETREKVIKDLNLAERLEDKDLTDLHRWLERKVDIRSLRGGIILIEMKDRDAELAKDIVGEFASATRVKLAIITERQTEYKREVLEKLVSDASQRLGSAEAKYNDFRLRRGYVDPDLSVKAISVRVPSLREAIREKEIAINAARRIYTDEHIVLVQLKAERDSLQSQLREALGADARAESGTVGEAVAVTPELFRLQRELEMARSLYNGYLRFLEGTSLEDMTSTASIRILEEPYVDTSRQVWWPAAALAFALALLWGAMEAYRIRPPLGTKFGPTEQPTETV